MNRTQTSRRGRTKASPAAAAGAPPRAGSTPYNAALPYPAPPPPGYWPPHLPGIPTPHVHQLSLGYTCVVYPPPPQHSGGPSRPAGSPPAGAEGTAVPTRTPPTTSTAATATTTATATAATTTAATSQTGLISLAQHERALKAEREKVRREMEAELAKLREEAGRKGGGGRRKQQQTTSSSSAAAAAAAASPGAAAGVAAKSPSVSGGAPTPQQKQPKKRYTQPVNNAKWHTRFDQLRAYMSAHGNEVPPKVCPSDPILGRWVHRQRCCHAKKDRNLTEEKVRMLEGLVGWRWNVSEKRRGKGRKNTEEKKSRMSSIGDMDGDGDGDGGGEMNSTNANGGAEGGSAADVTGGSATAAAGESSAAAAAAPAAAGVESESESESEDEEEESSSSSPRRRTVSERASAARGNRKIRRTMRLEAKEEEEEWLPTAERIRRKSEEAQLRKKLRAEEREKKKREDAEKPKEPRKRGPQKGPSERQNVRWNSHFEQLRAFKDVHGHCNVPAKHPQCKRLGTWCADQRTQHRFLREGKPTVITPERVRRLTELGFKWIRAKTEKTPWDVRLQQLAEYRVRHGDCNISQYGCTDPECPPGLGAWAHEQRRFYKKPDGKRLTQERIDKLEELGFVWKLRNRTFDSRRTNTTAPSETSTEMSGNDAMGTEHEGTMETYC